MPVGRFAPSPTGPLHLGNLRTAMLAWLFARSTESSFLLRFEDLDGAVRPEHYESQARDLLAIGVDWDGSASRQTNRTELYRDVIADLASAGLTYPCYCSRREIREATQAPNGPSTQGAYPGTCRDLTQAERTTKEAGGRPPALRVRTEPDAERSFTDLLRGDVTAPVDDFVIQRNDGIPAYNLIVVIDDHEQGVEQVVRADDILDSTARQLFVHELIGIGPPSYAHLPLILAPDGNRLAKRDGATTLDDRRELGQSPDEVRRWLLETAGQTAGANGALSDWVDTFKPQAIPADPTQLTTVELSSS